MTRGFTLFILRDGERMRASVLYYNAKLWTQFYISGRNREQGWLRSVCASSQSNHTLLFRIDLRWMYIPMTHTGLQKIQNKTT